MRLRADVEPEPAVGDVVVGDDPRFRLGLEGGRRDDVHRQLGVVRERVFVAQLLGHLAAHQHLVRAAAEVDEDAELVLDLGPARDEDERALDLADQASEHLQLLLEQHAGVGGEQPRDAHGRGVCAVRGAERVVDEQVAAFGEPPGRLRVVLRLAGVEARVLEHLHALVGE